MYTFVFGILQRVGCHSDIVLHRTRKSANRRPCHSLADLHYRIKIAGTRHRKTGLYHVDAQILKRTRHLYFLNSVELTSGHLLAVTKRCIKYKQFIAHTLNTK